MKKLLIVNLMIILLIGVFCLPALAGGISLLPDDIDVWIPIEYDGEIATAEIREGATVIRGSQNSWPAVGYGLEGDNSITLDINSSAFEFDLTTKDGNANIVLYMKGSTPFNYDTVQTKCVFLAKCIEEENIHFCSGDLLPGTYKGSISFKELSEHSEFPDNSLNNDGTLTITGIKIFTVYGAKVTVRALTIVNGDDKKEQSDESNDALTSTDDYSDNDFYDTLSDVFGPGTEDFSSDDSNPINGDESINEIEQKGSTGLVILGAILAIVLSVIIIVVRRRRINKL